MDARHRLRIQHKLENAIIILLYAVVTWDFIKWILHERTG